MRIVLTLLLAGLPLLAQAEACIIHSQSNQLDVKLCQENRTIPQQLFRNGFCAPQLKGQRVEVSFAPQCPVSSYGVCRGARVSGTPYQQDIHYYGVATDATYLKPACEQQYKGVWMAR